MNADAYGPYQPEGVLSIGVCESRYAMLVCCVLHASCNRYTHHLVCCAAVGKIKNINSIYPNAPSKVLNFFDEYAPGEQSDRIDHTCRVLQEAQLKAEQDLILQSLNFRIVESPCKCYQPLVHVYVYIYSIFVLQFCCC
jgi:hypothetical protein